MALSHGSREPIPLGDPPVQILPSAKEIAGKEVTFEINAPERADWRVVLRKLNSGEEGLVRRYIMEDKARRTENKNFYLAQFEADFDENPQDHLETYLSQKTAEQRRAEVEAALQDLERLTKALREDDETSQKDFQRQFVQFGQRNSQMGPELERELGRLVRAFSDEKADAREAKKSAYDILTKLLNQQVRVQEELLDAQNTKWDDLSDETRAYVKQWYFRFRWDFEDGTIERNAHLKVLTTHRERAPRMVLDGRERHIYPAINAWRELKDQLDSTDDPEKREGIEAQMREQEAIVERWSSALTGSFNDRFELGAVADPQVRQGAWDEVRNTIDNLRDETDPSKVKKSLVVLNSTYDQGSWETIIDKSNIYLQFGVSKNALKRLRSINEDGLLAIMEELKDPNEKDKDLESKKRRAKRELEDKKKRAEKYRTDKAEQERIKTQALAEQTDADNEITALEKFIKDNNLMPTNTGGGNNNRRSSDAFQSLNDARSRRRSAFSTIQAAEATIQRLKEAELRLNGDPSKGLPGEIKEAEENIAKVEKEHAEEKEKKKVGIYNTLLGKLEKFTTQHSMGMDFYEEFTDQEVQLIAKLGGAAVTGKHPRKKRRMLIVADMVHDPDVIDPNDPTKVTFQGDYAFINVGAIGNQNGRISPTAVEDILSHPDRFPEVAKLMEKLKSENKIVIILNTPVLHDLDGGVRERQTFGTGHGFDVHKMEELKKRNHWTDIDLFKAWLDSLEIQAELGVRPEDIEERYMSWVAKQHQLRNNHFSAEEGWTFLNSNVASSSLTFFETTIRRMVDHGLHLDSHEFRKFPFNQYLGRTNEYAITIVDSDLNRTVKYRNQELTHSDEAPKTLAARLYQSINNKLALYHQRSMIGGQTISNGEGMSDDESDKIGSFIQANLRLIEDKIERLKAIYDDDDITPEERIERMLEFRDKELVHLAYDVLDENGEFVEENGNPELWEYYNATSQWLGKLKRNQREAEEALAYTMMNRNSTEEDIELAKKHYNAQLQERRNFEIQQHMLGLQATGKLKGLDNRQIGSIIAKRHAKVGVEALFRIQEHSMRAQFGLDTDEAPTVLNIGRRIVGKLAKNRIADAARGLGRMFGIGDRFLKEVDQDTIAAHIRKKMDTEILKRASAHVALSIRTGYQNSWAGVLNPSQSTLLYNEENTGGILGDVSGPAVELSRTGKAYMDALERRIAEDVGDAIDRTIGNNIHPMIRAAKARGWNINEMMKVYLDAGMNDSQEVRNGEYDMYSKKKTEISMIESAFITEVAKRVDVNRSLLPHRSPDDTNYVRFNESKTPMIRQHPDYK